MIKNNSNDNKPTNKPEPETEPEAGPETEPVETIVSTEPEYKKRVNKTSARHLRDTAKYYQKNKVKASAHVLDLYHTKYKIDPEFKAKKSAYMKARYERKKQEIKEQPENQEPPDVKAKKSAYMKARYERKKKEIKEQQEIQEQQTTQ